MDEGEEKEEEGDTTWLARSGGRMTRPIESSQEIRCSPGKRGRRSSPVVC